MPRCCLLPFLCFFFSQLRALGANERVLKSEQLRKREGVFPSVDCSPSSSLARVEEDVLQPVKGIELSEEDRGEMVPNMGI